MLSSIFVIESIPRTSTHCTLVHSADRKQNNNLKSLQLCSFQVKITECYLRGMP